MSAKKQGGLGRGLGALIPTEAPAQADPAVAPDPDTELPAGPGAHPESGTAPGPDAPTTDDAAAYPTANAAVSDRPAADDETSAAHPGAADPGTDDPGVGHPVTGSAAAGPTAAEPPGVQQPGGDGSADSLEAAAPAGPAAAAPGTVEPNVSAADGLRPVPGATFAEIPVAAVHPNPQQPRQVFDEDALAELVHSIREFGVLQPIVVRPDGTEYELVMGERRLRAAAAAGLTDVPAIIRSTADDAMLRDALLENIHRAQLNPLEEAAAYQQLLEEFGSTHDELARRIGRSRPQVSNTIRLLQLSLPVQRRVAAGVLSAGHARALLSLADREQQDEVAGRIVAEGLSVRATEELVALAQHGGASRPARERAAPRVTAPHVADLAAELSDVFDTRVRIELGRRKGRVTVEFASIDDLERIVAVMAPQVSDRRRGTAPEPDQPAPS